MSLETALSGTLFAEDYYQDSIVASEEWQAFDDAALDAFATALVSVFERFPIQRSPNESQTEDDLIWPVLGVLGWTASLRQQNLSPHGRENVPDGLLFADDAAKARANALVREWRRYAHGLVVVESKRWLRPLDRRTERQGEETAPSTQMLRYLRRVDDLSTGNLRWGILTNGAHWRLYYQGARSVSEQFFEVDLAAVLDLPEHNEGLFALSDAERRHGLKLFTFFFRCEAFLPGAADPRTFHQRALDEGRFHQERVATNLSDLVFGQVFPELARAIAASAPEAPLDEVRDAALVLLYRLLFILYAEDRNLLPVREERYDDYGLRNRVRGDVGHRKDRGDVFSDTAARYWAAIDDLSRVIDSGDASIGLPPYNGGLFDRERNPLLGRVRLDDRVMADVIDALSFEVTPDGRRYINYRDLSVQQIGSIYERLLEHEVVFDGEAIVVRLNPFARKGSGSYYTPDDLVRLILDETIDTLVQSRLHDFTSGARRLRKNRVSRQLMLRELRRLDPAEKLLELKICDPAMGSGHFLVGLVDYLADRVIAAMAEAEATMNGYVSPLNGRIEEVRRTIRGNAEERGWALDAEHLDDRRIVRRMVLKRCVYGVDKNPMAVELAKVSLWLHTFTAGAPLSFLDHHLRCGDSLFGCWVRQGIDQAEAEGVLFLREPLNRATNAATSMEMLEWLTDAEIDEANQSAGIFAEIQSMTAPLDHFLSLIHAFKWLNCRDTLDKAAFKSFLAGAFGDPIDIAAGMAPIGRETDESRRFVRLYERAQRIIANERFLNWQIAFPGVWSNWGAVERNGGFDAVIGNPPWDRMKLQQVEWFAARRPEIAHAQRAADRKRMIRDLREAGDPLAIEFDRANEQTDSALRVVRTGDEYPWLSRGDVNIYSLFVERAMNLVHSQGAIGLLTPSGIASDKTAAPFFQSVATEGRLRALYDFENRRPRYAAPLFFPDVDSRFKFCAFIAGRHSIGASAQCAFFLQDVIEVQDSNHRFPLMAEDFASVNPNTGTAPIFRTRRDAELTTAIYRELPVLVDRSSGEEIKTWPVKYTTKFHMTNDSGRFRTREELEEREGAWPVSGNRFDSAAGQWVPLYEGKMVQAFDHRAASIVVNPKNLHRPAQPLPATEADHRNPNWLPEPQYWVASSECGWSPELGWVLGFKEITAPTNARTFIAALLPAVGFGNKVPVFEPEAVGLLGLLQAAEPDLPYGGPCPQVPPAGPHATMTALCPDRREWLLAANFNATVFDFVTRQKVHGQTLNLFIVEQLPVVPLVRYDSVYFGPKTASEVIGDAVLELTYTSHDMATLARDMGYLDATGDPKPPFRWDEERRLRLRAKLDAVYFHLYGITNREDVRYVYSTFPIVQRQETASYGRYRTCDLCLAWLNALAAGCPDAEPQV